MFDQILFKYTHNQCFFQAKNIIVIYTWYIFSRTYMQSDRTKKVKVKSDAESGSPCAPTAARPQCAEGARHRVCVAPASGRTFLYNLLLASFSTHLLASPPSSSFSEIHVTLHQFGDTALPCTDDSDCITLGWKYGCFLYR